MSAVRALAPANGAAACWNPAARLKWLAAIQAHLAAGADADAAKKPLCSGSTQLAVAAALATLAMDGSGRVWAGQAKMRERSLLGRTALRAGLRALKAESWIDIQQRAIPGQRECDTAMISLRYPEGGPPSGPGGPSDGERWADQRQGVGRQAAPKEESKRESKARAWADTLSAQDWLAAKAAHASARGPWQIPAWKAAGCPEVAA